jgi:hypothetical protein
VQHTIFDASGHLIDYQKLDVAGLVALDDLKRAEHGSGTRR